MAQGIKAQIDERQVQAMAQLGASNNEIAEFFGVRGCTIASRFSRNLQKGRAEMKLTLRQTLLKRAKEGGSDACLIFACKNILGMSDRIEQKQEVSGKNGAALGPMTVRILDTTKPEPNAA
jgi:hypothetical protein